MVAIPPGCRETFDSYIDPATMASHQESSGFACDIEALRDLSLKPNELDRQPSSYSPVERAAFLSAMHDVRLDAHLFDDVTTRRNPASLVEQLKKRMQSAYERLRQRQPLSDDLPSLADELRGIIAEVDGINELFQDGEPRLGIGRSEEVVQGLLSVDQALSHCDDVFLSGEVRQELLVYLKERTYEILASDEHPDWFVQTIVDDVISVVNGYLEFLADPASLSQRQEFFRSFEAAYPGCNVDGLVHPNDRPGFLRDSPVLMDVLQLLEPRLTDASMTLSEFLWSRSRGLSIETALEMARKDFITRLTRLAGRIGISRLKKFFLEDPNVDVKEDVHPLLAKAESLLLPEDVLQAIDAVDTQPSQALALRMHEDLSEEERQHLYRLFRECPECRVDARNILAVAAAGGVDLMQMDAEALRQISAINMVSFTERDSQEVASLYRMMLSYFSLEQLARTGLSLECSPEQSSELMQFARFLSFTEHLIPGTDLGSLVKRFKTSGVVVSEDFLPLASVLQFSRSWDDAFRLAAKVQSLSGGYPGIVSFADELPRINDETLIAFRTAYLTFVGLVTQTADNKKAYDRRRGYTAQMPIIASEENVRVRALAESMIDPAGIAHTASNRLRLREMHPIFLQVYDEKRAAIGLTNEVVPEAPGSRAAEYPTLEVAEAPSGYDRVLRWGKKALTRPAEYTASRALAVASNKSGIRLSHLKRRSVSQNGIQYEQFLQGSQEIVRIVHLEQPPADLEYGLFFSELDALGDRAERQTPMQSIPGAILEVTGAMVDDERSVTDPFRMVPLELFAIDGTFRQRKVHALHDGVLIIGRDGIPHMEHIEAIPGEMLGLPGRTIDGRFADRDVFAKAVVDQRLSVMQTPIYMKDGRVFPVMGRGVPWLKRAMVTFPDGTFGFVEARQPVDNRTFAQLLIDVGISDALVLDTGQYNHYTDINGVTVRSDNINNILIYCRRKQPS